MRYERIDEAWFCYSWHCNLIQTKHIKVAALFVMSGFITLNSSAYSRQVLTIERPALKTGGPFVTKSEPFSSKGRLINDQ